MIKRAFTMKLKPGGLAEYKRHHDEIWPELAALLKEAIKVIRGILTR